MWTSHQTSPKWRFTFRNPIYVTHPIITQPWIIKLKNIKRAITAFQKRDVINNAISNSSHGLLQAHKNADKINAIPLQLYGNSIATQWNPGKLRLQFIRKSKLLDYFSICLRLSWDSVWVNFYHLNSMQGETISTLSFVSCISSQYFYSKKFDFMKITLHNHMSEDMVQYYSIG